MMTISIFILALCGLHILLNKFLSEEQWKNIINFLEKEGNE